MKSIFSKKDNVLSEQPDMKKEICILGIYPCTVAGTKKVCECEQYNNHLKSLRALPCAPNSFVDGVEYEEGKDYIIQYEYQAFSEGEFKWGGCDENFYRITSANRRIIAVPITQSNEEDELWLQVAKIMRIKITTVDTTELKSRFTITRKGA